VKANPSPALLKVLWDAGVTHFDVASIAEVRLVRGDAAGATLCFMHPVKPRSAIAKAYFEHGVRTFSLDTIEELEKIVARPNEGNLASDLNLLRAAARVLRPFRAEPRLQVRRRPRRCKPLLQATRQAWRTRWASASTSAARR
jgi:ornithine decarboxylase